MANTSDIGSWTADVVRRFTGASASAERRRPPGPKGLLPVLRASAHLTKDFLSCMCHMAEEYSGPDMNPVGFNVLGQQMYLVLHPEQIQSILADNDVFFRTLKYFDSFRFVLGYNSVTVPNEEWKPMRRRTAGYFSLKQIEAYTSIFVQVMSERGIPLLKDKARRGQAVDLFPEMLDISSIAVFMSFLGDQLEDPPKELYQALNRIFCYIRRNMWNFWFPPLWIPTPQNRELNRDLELLRNYIRPRIFTDRDKPTMLGDIIRTHTGTDGTMNVQRILEETIANLVGGSETTIVLMVWAMFYIAQEREVQDRLAKEIDAVVGSRLPTSADLKKMPYLHNTISETLRLRSPAYMQTRMAIKDSQLGGYDIEKGAMLLASQYITHQDPRVWKNPRQFNPDRFASDSKEAPANRKSQAVFFPFGGGLFSCLGMNYAVNEAAVTVLCLLQHFEFELLNPAQATSLGIDARVTLRPDQAIYLKIRERAPRATSYPS